MARKLLAFGWYGGKYSHLNWLLPLLPESAPQYLEAFGGSAAVLLNRRPAAVETYNDLDGEVVNFFRVLRTQRISLLQAIENTPFSREEFELACVVRCPPLWDRVERARRFYVRARQCYGGLAQTATPGRWASTYRISRNGMAQNASRWLHGQAALAEVAERLSRVQIERLPFERLIERAQDRRTLLYCDPPYLHSTRGDNKCYAHEMTRQQHRQLLEILLSSPGKRAISGYRSQLYDRVLASWNRHDVPARSCKMRNVSAAHPQRRVVQECLWTSY